MKKEYFDNYWKFFVLIFILLLLVSAYTKYFGSTDIGDYSDVAKYFAGKYSADIRSSHSYLYGAVHSPFLKFFDSFFIFKITSLIFLILITLSVYVISGKNKKSLILMGLSPVLWYMAPWINPIQLSSLFMLWSWHFIRRYDENGKIKNLAFSGIFIGLGWAFWDTIFFFGIILFVTFLFNKKLSHFLFALLFILIGLSPRLILDQIIFGFPGYSILKSTLGNISFIFGGIYGSGHTEKSFGNLIPLILALPFYSWVIYKREYIKENLKSIIFVTLSILLLLWNPQVRYVLTIAPIIIVMLSNELNNKQFKKYILISLVLIALFIFPYLIQVGYGVDKQAYGVDSVYILKNEFKVNFQNEPIQEKYLINLEELVREKPNETFVVGNSVDGYQMLADIYWGSQVREFVSIQDYSLWFDNETNIYKKEFRPQHRINSRRQIWVAGGMDMNLNDPTNFEEIEFGIGIGEKINLEEFSFVKQYGDLYLSKKE